MNRFDALLARTGSLRRIAPLRIAAGPLTLIHLQPFFAAALDGRSPVTASSTPSPPGTR
jgi:hypothetical protein